jgi:hypothetical protein
MKNEVGGANGTDVGQKYTRGSGGWWDSEDKRLDGMKGRGRDSSGSGYVQRSGGLL